MGRFLDETPAKTYKGKFLDDSPVETVTPEIVPSRKRTIKDKILDAGGGTMFLAGGGQDPEETLPMVGQVVGSSIPGVNSFGGGVAGATAGQALRQGIKSIRGTRESAPRRLFGFGLTAPGIVNDLAGEAAGTAAMEGAFRAIPKVLFPKQIGGKARQLAGEELGKIAENVTKKAPFANTAKNPFIDDIEQAFKDAPFERGPEVQALAQVKKKLLDMKGPLSFDQARQLEQQLGREAKFASDVTQGHFVKAPKAPRLNESIKGIRSKISGKVDEMAAQAGFPEFEEASRKFADLARKYPESSLQKTYSPTGMLIRGAIGGAGVVAPSMVGAGPLGAVAAPALLWANVPPKIKTAMFRKFVDTAGGKIFGRGATILASEGARKVFGS